MAQSGLLYKQRHNKNAKKIIQTLYYKIPAMTIQERIYAQLSKNSKKKLSKQKVELSSVRDYEDLSIDILLEADKALEEINEVMTILNNVGDNLASVLMRIQNEASPMLANIETMSEELGIEVPQEVQNFTIQIAESGQYIEETLGKIINTNNLF